MTEKKPELILAFESSCDETSVAVVEDGVKIRSNVIASQINSQKRFGGVVPEVASRHHVEQVTLCAEEAMTQAGVTYGDLTAVAVTYGPGLVGALLIGVSAAKAVAFAHQLPLIPVNHMAGHIYAARLVKPLVYPLMALLVSGGHTELVYMRGAGEFEIIGDTRDDAAGEAFDKVGRVLNLAYPAGKKIDDLSKLGQDTFNFPRAMIKDANYDFSFSGLKSAFINKVHNAEQRGEKLSKPDLAASFQASVIDVLITKTMRACQAYGVGQLVLAGGVAANSALRSALTSAIDQEDPNLDFVVPPIRLCSDNGAMIGAAAHVMMARGARADLDLNADPSLSFAYAEEVLN
ncbi:tRNA (adenosine(37)-N6)-threonylcarbamoyltransferase complex transferase subunit TsaD [Loigolactobacillus backii]|uniref:tRNA (adenosine(37)-N6)-threonylcarbamoyltransferase complex transferase subunit TsaD n=1 Tax=Loigolactobacillus backii TaxID=375175 RepID=UPI0007F06E4E|nr:tRNA (adenosine(37)-N6)-threonylcarbamoyltransferase complex transferase subunit TsaD [Loigolactobacillus backii]ANK59176.1 N(6)-L-threonylcarbamoyladenine synthase TsaD [Loigolactobacillus backii]ANK64166.1 N(6)-L-threonylcarbamoyladenine synthase TsaD [Loigolactobacillus backii]ANK67439.1 N(6)-L-threonylcarbamoyladenine synthase TsaD [Loigolactobacillus backii]MDA5388300.1 tRNA (adenosine(37)-N6)-threonylcarbamoyltransferase complex transferase subunit TsaD [Loigolactobacillus backii]MDA5